MAETEEGKGQGETRQPTGAPAPPKVDVPPKQGAPPATAPPPSGSASYPPPSYPPPSGSASYPPPSYPPPSGYPPPTYASPAYAAPSYAPGHVTFQGTGRVKTALLVTIIGTLLTAFGSLMAWSVSGTSGAGVGTVALVGLMSLVGGVMALIGGVLGLAGLWDMHKARAEFGKEHAQALRKGRSYVIGGFLMEALGVVAIFVFTLMGMTINFQTTEVTVDPDALVAGSVIAGLADVLAVYLFALGFLGFIEKLMTRAGRGKRTLFVVVSMVGAVLSLVFQVWAFSQVDMSAALTGGGLGGETTGLTGLASLVGVAGLWIYRTMVEDAERGARNMIASGKYDPDAVAGAQ